MKNGSFQLALLLKEYSIISMKSFQVTIVDLQECSDVFNTSRLLNQPDIKEEEEDGLLCAVGTGGACLVIKQRNNVKFKTFASFGHLFQDIFTLYSVMICHIQKES